MTWPGLLESQFISVGFVDDTPFESFNSRIDFPGMEHCTPWISSQARLLEGELREGPERYSVHETILQLMLYTYNYSAVDELPQKAISNLVPSMWFTQFFMSKVFLWKMWSMA